ncbi:hypothetical protein MASR2M70_04670 [Bacillota bacterium]
MKRRELIKKLESDGWYLERNGTKHDIYRKGNKIEMVPRHSEIKELTAKAILKKWGLE